MTGITKSEYTPPKLHVAEVFQPITDRIPEDRKAKEVAQRVIWQNILGDSKGSTLLHSFSKRVDVSAESLKTWILAKRLPVVDLYDSKQRTPLQVAIIDQRQWDKVAVLLDFGADPLLPDRKKWTALHSAVVTGHIGIIEKVLNTYSDLNWQTIANHVAQRACSRPLCNYEQMSQMISSFLYLEAKQKVRFSEIGAVLARTPAQEILEEHPGIDLLETLIQQGFVRAKDLVSEIAKDNDPKSRRAKWALLEDNRVPKSDIEAAEQSRPGRSSEELKELHSRNRKLRRLRDR